MSCHQERRASHVDCFVVYTRQHICFAQPTYIWAMWRRYGALRNICGVACVCVCVGGDRCAAFACTIASMVMPRLCWPRRAHACRLGEALITSHVQLHHGTWACSFSVVEGHAHVIPSWEACNALVVDSTMPMNLLVVHRQPELASNIL